MATDPRATHDSLTGQDAWWKSAVVYQIYPRSFNDTNADGIGDIPGVIEKLDYLQTLGIDVIWLSPIYKSPQDDNGYDISDYQDIDPMFGTLDDVDRLLKEAHDRDIRIVMDLVVNHSSDEHPWFVESRSSKDNPKRDWYWWRPAREGFEPNTPGAEPTNWSSFFSGPVWEWDEATQEYYLHLFSRKQPDLNWENEDVRNAVYEMMNWWLDRGIDGFRMDVINLISKDTNLPDGPVTEGDMYGDGFEFYTDGPRIHEFLHEMYERVFKGRDKMLTFGEMPGVTVDEAKLYTAEDREELDMVFTFEHMGLDREWGKYHPKPLDLRDLKSTLARWQVGLQDEGWNSLYWNNHDQPRIVSRFGDDGEYRVESAKMLGTILHMQKGTPYVYQGEEIGLTNFPYTSLDDFQDIEARNYIREQQQRPDFDAEQVLSAIGAQGRDNARYPVSWNDGPQAGFTDGTPWFPVHPEHKTINAEAAVADPDSVFAYYQRLIQLRHEEPTIVHGDYHLLLADDANVFAFTRSHDGETMLTLGNFSGEEQAVELEDAQEWAGAELVIGNYADQPKSDTLTLRPWEARVYRKR